MITKHVIGRLGNQMFQYATVRAFQLKYRPNEKIILDFSEVYSRDNEGYREELSCFNLENYHCGKMRMTLKQKIANFNLLIIKFLVLSKSKISHSDNYNQIMYKVENKIQTKLNKYGLYSFRLGYYDFCDSKSKNLCFFGTFESAKYFDDIKEQLQKEFTPKYDILSKNFSLYEKIKNTNSVCVTIRRGDFVNNAEYKKNLYVCTPEYFSIAIKRMKKEIDNPTFFVFSDDVKWCRENMSFPKNTYFESGDDPVWEKIRLMYSCKHFIISNSTFSWWAQYLSRNEDKVVIAPSRWGNQTYKENGKIDIYQDSWILIDIKEENSNE